MRNVFVSKTVLSFRAKERHSPKKCAFGGQCSPALPDGPAGCESQHRLRDGAGMTAKDGGKLSQGCCGERKSVSRSVKDSSLKRDPEDEPLCSTVCDRKSAPIELTRLLTCE